MITEIVSALRDPQADLAPLFFIGLLWISFTVIEAYRFGLHSTLRFGSRGHTAVLRPDDSLRQRL